LTRYNVVSVLLKFTVYFLSTTCKANTLKLCVLGTRNSEQQESYFSTVAYCMLKAVARERFNNVSFLLEFCILF